MIIIFNSEAEALEAVRKITIVGTYIYVCSGIYVENQDNGEQLIDYNKIFIDDEIRLFYDGKHVTNPIAYGVNLDGNLNKKAITTLWDTPVKSPTGQFYIKSPYNSMNLYDLRINGVQINQLFDSFLPTPVSIPEDWHN